MSVIRSTGSLRVWALGATLGTLALIDIAIGDAPALAHAAAPVLLALWALAMILVRPSIAYDAERIVVTNPGMITEVPWSAVRDLVRGHQITVVTDDRRLVAWGSPPLPRRRPLQRQERLDLAMLEVERAWEQARINSPRGASARAVVRRPDVALLAVGAALVVATVLSLAL